MIFKQERVMNFEEHFAGFYEAVCGDQRVGPVHISLYMAIVYLQLMQTGDAVQINRLVLMGHAKINARSTYNKTMRDLHDFGYIRYLPSCSCCLRSLVYVKKI